MDAPETASSIAWSRSRLKAWSRINGESALSSVDWGNPREPETVALPAPPISINLAFKQLAYSAECCGSIRLATLLGPFEMVDDCIRNERSVEMILRLIGHKGSAGFRDEQQVSTR
jgi:hypothetical protein